jgi:glycosidase
MMDLVINHTAIDSVLVEQYPMWYCYNEDGTIRRPGCEDNGTWIEWGDLGSIDNEYSSDKERLWRYWLDLIKHYASIGFDGFRCDAAYHVPNVLWEYLFENSKKEFPHIKFFGETLGCTAEQVVNTAKSGFDYIFNFSKWWDLKEDWFLREFGKFVGTAPSISFPETHDTNRWAEETGGNEAASKLRYAVAAYLSTGVMIPVGYEYGFKKKLDVVHTMPDDWEEKIFDLTDFIKQINECKSSYQVLNEDRLLSPVWVENDEVRGYIKTSLDDKERVLLLINTNSYEHKRSYVRDIYGLLGSSFVQDITPTGYKMDHVPCSFEYYIHPGDVKVFYAKIQ